MDASTKVYKLKFKSTGVWLYFGLIDIPKTKSLAFDTLNYYDISLSSEVLKVTILFFDYAVSYVWPNNNLNATSKTLYQLGYGSQTAGLFLTTNNYIYSEDPEEDTLYVISSENQLTLPLLENTQIIPNKEYNLITIIEPTQATTSLVSNGFLKLNATYAI